MTVYKVTVKSSFFIDADSMKEAKEVADSAVAKLPNAEVNIKATKMMATEFDNRAEIA